MAKKIVIDEEICIGCGNCELVAPKHFKLKSELSKVIKQYSPEDKEEIKEARDNCPVKAIKIVEE